MDNGGENNGRASFQAELGMDLAEITNMHDSRIERSWRRDVDQK